MRRARSLRRTRLRLGAGLLAAAMLTLTGCTGTEPAPTALPTASPAPGSASGGIPAVLSGVAGIEADTELLAEGGTGPAVLQVPDVAGHSALVYTITCTSPDVPFRLRFLLESGQEAHSLSSAGCGAGIGTTPQLDPGDLPVMLEVTVPEGTQWTAYVYGTPPV